MKYIQVTLRNHAKPIEGWTEDDLSTIYVCRTLKITTACSVIYINTEDIVKIEHLTQVKPV